MPKSQIQKDIDDMQALAGVLELDRLKLVDGLLALQRTGKPYTDQDLQRLALYGDAIRSVREAIADSARI